MNVPHDRQFSHDNDFFLLERARWTHSDTGMILLSVTIVETNDDAGRSLTSYEAHLPAGRETTSRLKNLMSYSPTEQKQAWFALRPELHRVPGDPLN